MNRARFACQIDEKGLSMKNILKFSILLMALYVLTVGVSAAFNTYSISELDLEITIPSDYSVITRNTDANDPIFDILGVSKSSVISQFETNNIYLNAISNITDEEIVVIMTDNTMNDFNLLSDSTLSMLMSTVVSEYENYGLSVSKHEIYQHKQAKFVKIYFSDS